MQDVWCLWPINTFLYSSYYFYLQQMFIDFLEKWHFTNECFLSKWHLKILTYTYKKMYLSLFTLFLWIAFWKYSITNRWVTKKNEWLVSFILSYTVYFRKEEGWHLHNTTICIFTFSFKMFCWSMAKSHFPGGGDEAGPVALWEHKSGTCQHLFPRLFSPASCSGVPNA